MLTCFKAYDIRGKLGEELNEDIAYRIGRAFAEYTRAKSVVVGGDIRLSSEQLKQSLSTGLMDAGADVLDLGMTGTEEIYYAAAHLDVDGGIEVTASHNPLDYNGMKLVSRGAKPISGDSGLFEIRDLAEKNQFTKKVSNGKLREISVLDDYVSHILGYVNLNALNRPMTLVVNSGNGAAGHVIDAIERFFSVKNLPIRFIKVNHEPNGTFPNGIPNPLLPQNRSATSDAVIKHGADIGIAWDGDFDRCFLFDENGNFIEGYYIVGLLAEAFLRKFPGEKIIHDPRLVWNTIDIVQKSGGIPVMSKTGHAFIKERMRSENAIYGGEMSAHHYFRDFAYCDSGMIPWLLALELISLRNLPLSKLVGERIGLFPCSGEINYQVRDVSHALERVEHYFSHTNNSDLIDKDYTDGLSMEFKNWRFNLRASNTEPVLRLNIETRQDIHIISHRITSIERLIEGERI